MHGISSDHRAFKIKRLDKFLYRWNFVRLAFNILDAQAQPHAASPRGNTMQRALASGFVERAAQSFTVNGYGLAR